MPSVDGDPPRAASTRLVALCILGFVLVTLGPSLVGLRVFAGLDLLGRYAPWGRTGAFSGPVASVFVQDHIDNLLPAYSAFRARLLDGDYAAWLPYSAGGSPLGSLPSYGLLSPLSLPYFLLPTWLAPAWVKLLEIAVALGGMFFFLRRLSATRAAALLGGMVFISSGFMVAWTNWPQTRVGAFIPVLFWAVERYLQLRTIRAAVPVALAVAGLLLGGFPAVAGLALYAAAGYVVVRLIADRAEGGLRRILTDVAVVGGAVVAGVGLTAVQLVPFVSYLGALDLSYREDQFFTPTPEQYLATAVFPGAFFSNDGAVFGRALNPVEFNTHIGSVALVLIAVAVLRWRAVRRPVGALPYLVAASVLCLWLAYVQGPLVEWMSVLPIFSGNPIGRVRSVLGFTAAAVAGLGFDALLRHAGARSWRPRIEHGVLLIGLAGLFLAGYLTHRRQAPTLGDPVGIDVLLGCAAAAAAVLLVVVAARSLEARRAAVLVLPVLVAIQGVVAVQNFWPTSSVEQFYPDTAAHRFLQEETGADRVAVAGSVLLPSSTAHYGIRTVGGHAFHAPTWGQLLEEMNPGALRVPTLSSLRPMVPEQAEAPGLDRLSARYYLSQDVFPVPGVPTAQGVEDRSLLLRSGTTYTAPLEPQPLRGIGIRVTSASAPFGEGSSLTVRIEDADGAPIVQGTRPIAGAPRQADFYLPLAAEDPPDQPGPWTVSVSTAQAPDLVVRATAADTPQLIVVRPAEDGLRLVRVADGVTIYEREGALPRIRWAGTAEVITDPVARVHTVAHTRYADDEVVLSAPGKEGAGLPAELTVLEDSGDTIRVRVEARGAGYLVVADAIQTDWVAAVDGAPADIVEAEHAVGAVYVEAGGHDITLRYSPSGRPTGAIVSTLAATGLAAAAVPPRWWRRTRPPTDQERSQ